MALTNPRCGKVEERAQAGQWIFELWRLDDNGNEFLVEAFGDRESAEKRVAELAAGGHKQMYWVREVAVPGRCHGL